MSDDTGSYPPEFLQAVEQAVARMGWRVVRCEEGGVVVIGDDEGECTYGLANLFRRTRTLPPADWVTFIANHLARVSAGTEAARRDEELHSVAHRLLVR